MHVAYGAKTIGIALSASTFFADSKRLSAVEKLVNSIDLLPSKYSNIETLYLSNNLLSSVKNISQFQKLQTLSLSNNNVCSRDPFFISFLVQITSFESLYELQSCHSLRVLSLSNNPVTQLPYYRQHIICLFPRLETLDGEVSLPFLFSP